MDTEYGLLVTWYDTWLVVIGFAIALVLAVLVSARSDWNTGGLLLKTTMVVATLATLPLTLKRVGMYPGIEDDTTVGFLSLAGVAGALAVGLSYLIASRPRGDRRAEPETGWIVTSEQEVPLASDAEEATRTLGAADITGPGTVPATGAAEAPPAWLVFKSGPRTGQSIPLGSGVTQIGRAPENDVVLDDATVSRQHATIVFREGRYMVEDAGSSGGTLVEGTTAARTVLMSGASVQIGETELVFMQAEGTAAPAPMGAPAPGGGRPGETVIMDQPATLLAWLAVTAGPDKGKIFQLKAGDTTIGRDQENDVVIADAGVSRRHAMVKHQEGKFLLLDLGSSGGTRANGQPISGKALSTGGVISVGQTQLFMVDVEVQEAAVPASAEGATMVEQPSVGGGILVARSGPDAGKSFTLVEGENTMGRDPECRIVLTDTAVSRQHALVRRQGDSYMVYDLGSRGGTRVDGDSVTGSDLSAGDVISIGRTEIVLMQPQQ